jgi:hypothetical protein
MQIQMKAQPAFEASYFIKNLDDVQSSRKKIMSKDFLHVTALFLAD